MAQILVLSLTLAVTASAAFANTLERQFRDLPAEARRPVGPLFWLHGDESPERLNEVLDKVAEGGNGSFTAESRPHQDWLGEGWFRDLGVCLDAAKKHDLKMWIFDEDWWPSQTVAGRVPEAYAAKKLVGRAERVSPGNMYKGDPAEVTNFIAVVAGRLDRDGGVDADTLCDLTRRARRGPLKWAPPQDGREWLVMTFSWTLAPRLKQGNRLAVDGMSPDCVKWYIETVYKPHYARFGKEFGKAITGFFYDEPETPGDWGTELNRTLRKRDVDWMAAYVAWLFKLSGQAQAAAKYQYAEARAETWGRVMYGELGAWCHKHDVLSIGHFMEHNRLYANSDYCAGDLMALQKYSDMGGIDAVFTQFKMGQREARDAPCWQTPKLGSSVSHAYGKKDDLAMCEIFGARGQDLTYPEMKWWADHAQVSGINVLIPHSFNPRAPDDRDCPPYFYNGGFEPRFALYRVWADYAARLSLMLSGGRHVCPVAVLFGGNAGRVGAYTAPEEISTALQDSLYDCDWLPFERLASDETEVRDGELLLHGERYRALVVPPTEGMPVAAMEKVCELFESGGVVIGYGRLPEVSLTPEIGSWKVRSLRRAIWGSDPQPGPDECASNERGGYSYFLGETLSAGELDDALKAAEVVPPVRVLAGKTDGWVHALRRVDREGRDVLLIVNQNTNDVARPLTFLVPSASGVPEAWDAMRGEICSVQSWEEADGVALSLTLEPNESVLIRFAPASAAPRPPRLKPDDRPLASWPVPADAAATPVVYPVPEKGQKSPCAGVAFQGEVTLPAEAFAQGRRLYLACEMADDATEDAAAVRLNGAYAGGFIGKPHRLEVTRAVKPGANRVRIEPFGVRNVRVEAY